MQKLRFHTLDVFTDSPFSGNPLAVFTDADALPTTLMQQIARELNLSETVFVGAGQPGNHFPMRIFTPGGEIPFAGHPTIGTALLLSELELLDPQQRGALVLEQRVGPVPVQLEGLGAGAVARLRTARLPEISSSTLKRHEAAALLGLQPEQLVADPVVAGCGLPFVLLQIRDVAALGSISLDLSLWRRLLGAQPVSNLYCFSLQGGEAVRARMFDPANSIPEDPATGSAAAALAGYLAIQAAAPGSYRLRIEQGLEMGRASLMLTRVEVGPEGPEAVYVEGQARRISEGAFLLG
ncbi:PhzF family phenazine biosynthesis protein [Marinobacterium rhizophilum]|uniref:PhzF family phenazine biosynthesis protein n=1 Tax=Marinobacterium rhizophilum TaxID=420402 RepID=A0ABY5HP54_9GAMM|nr:PhzF family phenazine biosynthesis protein [Marinobacterium rhizophilum]UTW13739.1 PhzF family phenazine biosynthesis protein [Marinobacterium rhizophilum]